jgi:hypothetical protein
VEQATARIGTVAQAENSLGLPCMYGLLGTDVHLHVRVPSTKLSLQAVSSIADSVEAAAVVHADRGKIIAALVVEHVALDLRLAQLAELFGIDVDQTHVNVADITGGRRRASVGHYAPPNGLA